MSHNNRALNHLHLYPANLVSLPIKVDESIQIKLRSKKVIVFFIFNLLCFISNAQWTPMEGPFGGAIDDLIRSNDKLFAKTSHGFYLHQQTTRNWKLLQTRSDEQYSSYLIASHRDNIVLCKLDLVDYSDYFYKLYLTSDKGNTWQELNFPFDSVNALVANDHAIYIEANNKIFLTTDLGQNWQLSNIHSFNPDYGKLYEYDGYIYFTNPDHLYRSQKNKDNWTPLFVPGNSVGYTFFAFDSTYFLIDLVSDLMIRSVDAGITWTPTNPKKWIDAKFIKTGNDFYATMDSSIYKSSNNGFSFQRIQDLPYAVRNVSTSRDSLILGTEAGMFLSDKNIWRIKSYTSGINSTWISTLMLTENSLWALTWDENVFKTNTFSESWEFIDYPSETAKDIIQLGQEIFMLTDDRLIIKSVNEGKSWSYILTSAFYGCELNKMFIDETTILVSGDCMEGKKMFRNNPGDDNWNHFLIPEIDKNVSPLSFHTSGPYKFAVYEDKIARLKDGNWQVIASPTSYQWSFSQFSTGNNLIGYLEYRNVFPRYSLSISTDFGENWKKITTDSFLDNDWQFFRPYFINNTIIGFSGLTGDHIYISHDLGDTWKRFNHGMEYAWIDEFEIDENYIYMSTYGKGIYKRKIEDILLASIEDTGIDLNDVRIFPNPNTGSFRLMIPKSLDRTGMIHVVNHLGVEVHGQLFSDTDYSQIDLVLPAGMYFITITDGIKQYTGKVIIVP